MEVHAFNKLQAFEIMFMFYYKKNFFWQAKTSFQPAFADRRQLFQQNQIKYKVFFLFSKIFQTKILKTSRTIGLSFLNSIIH